MSQHLHFCIEYLSEIQNTFNLKFKCLKEDIGGIIPSIIRDRADELFCSSHSIKPGSWFNLALRENNIVIIYYFFKSDISNISKKLLELSEEENNIELKEASIWFSGLNVLISYLLNEEKIYCIDDNFIRIIAYLN